MSSAPHHLRTIANMFELDLSIHSMFISIGTTDGRRAWRRGCGKGAERQKGAGRRGGVLYDFGSSACRRNMVKSLSLVAVAVVACSSRRRRMLVCGRYTVVTSLSHSIESSPHASRGPCAHVALYWLEEFQGQLPELCVSYNLR